MFKKLVAEIVQAATIEDLDKISGSIDRAFQNSKITWNDNELLYDLIAKVSGGHYMRPGVVQIKEA